MLCVFTGVQQQDEALCTHFTNRTCQAEGRLSCIRFSRVVIGLLADGRAPQGGLDSTNFNLLNFRGVIKHWTAGHYQHSASAVCKCNNRTDWNCTPRHHTQLLHGFANSTARQPSAANLQQDKVHPHIHAAAMTIVKAAAPAGSLEALSTAFDVQVATLRQVAGLRCSDMMAHAADLGELEVQAASSRCIVLCRAI
jgi:hypothetical protein